MLLISIVILTYNSKKFIGQCLDSIYSQDWRDFEVIVVDNGSSDGTLGILKDKFPDILVIRNQDNLGACRARNQGIKAARGEWIVTLDCDIVLENNFMCEIIKMIKTAPESAGMIQPKIMKADKRGIYSAGIYKTFLRRFHDIGQGEIDSVKFGKQQGVFGVCSAAAAYRRDMLEAVRDGNGYFDERFFFLFEDVDLSWRAQRKGIKAIFSPQAVCYHHGNSSDTSEKVRQYLCLRNRYFTLFKNDSTLRIILSFIFYDIPRLFYFLMANPYALKAAKDIFVFKRN